VFAKLKQRCHKKEERKHGMQSYWRAMYWQMADQGVALVLFQSWRKRGTNHWLDGVKLRLAAFRSLFFVLDELAAAI